MLRGKASGARRFTVSMNVFDYYSAAKLNCSSARRGGCLRLALAAALLVLLLLLQRLQFGLDRGGGAEVLLVVVPPPSSPSQQRTVADVHGQDGGYFSNGVRVLDIHRRLVGHDYVQGDDILIEPTRICGIARLLLLRVLGLRSGSAVLRQGTLTRPVHFKC